MSSKLLTNLKIFAVFVKKGKEEGIGKDYQKKRKVAKR